LDSFSTVEIMFEFSKAVRRGPISLECLNDLDGVDRQKVSTLAESVRRAHAEAIAFMVTLIRVDSAIEKPFCNRQDT
jgi:hypothetical protein